MLPAPSHLSSSCEHPHLMKSWLMQLQLDSQPSSASEKTGSLAASSSSSSPRLAQSAPVVTADFDAPQTPHLSAGGPRERNFFPDVDPASLLNLPLLASEASTGLTSCAEGGGSTHGTSKHITTALSVDSNLSVRRSGTFELSYNDLKERKHKGNGVCYPFISIACGSSDLPATSPACQPPFEDHREQQPAAQPSHRLSRCFVSNITRISHEANTSGKLHICNPRRYTEERDGLPERGCGPWQKDFAELMDSCPPALTQYVVEFDQPVESSEDVLDCENIIKSQIDCTVEGQQRAHFSKRNSLQSSAQEKVVPEYILLQEGNSVEANTDSYEEQRAHFLKGNSSQSSVQIKAVPDDTLPEEAKSGEVNTDSNEGDLVGRRSCSHCGTLRTPLWRNGPQGPKSLCNACGIRYKKLRRRSGGTESFDLPESPLASLKLKSRPSRSLKRRRDKATYSQFSWEHKNVTETASKVQAIQNRKRSSSKVQGEDATGYSGESCLTSSRQSPSSGLRSPVTTYSEANFIVQDKKSSKSASVEHITLSGFYSVDETEAAVLLLALSRGLANASEICCYLYDTNFAY